MKQILVITTILSLLFFTLGCLKDEISKEQNTEIVQSKKYFSIDDFEITGFRDGGQNPFQFATSQVEYDPFRPGYPQTVINIQRLDSVKYFRISEPNAVAWDTEFDIYNITYYFKDGSTKQSNRIYAESILGNQFTYLPDTDYNQLAVNNPNNFETLKRGTRAESYPDHDCGKVKKRFPYTHYFNLDSVGVSPINGDRCSSNVFSYQLITIQ
jgi:hypothetical protein